MELAIRTAVTRLGGGMLERLLAADPGYRGPGTDCGAGHQAEFVSYRDKTIDTVLGPANWTVPAWLDRLLPRLAVEAGYRKG